MNLVVRSKLFFTLLIIAFAPLYGAAQTGRGVTAEPQRLTLLDFQTGAILPALQQSRVVLLGEFHLRRLSIDGAYQELLPVFKKAGFDCLLLEMPKNNYQEAFTAFNAGAKFAESIGPANQTSNMCFQEPGEVLSESMALTVLNRRGNLLHTARDQGFRLFAIDPNDTTGERAPTCTSLDAYFRNQYMANEIVERIQSGECKKVVVTVGAWHIYVLKRKANGKEFLSVPDLLPQGLNGVLKIRLGDISTNSGDETPAVYDFIIHKVRSEY